MPPSSPSKQVCGAIMRLNMADKSEAEISRTLDCTRILVYRTWVRYQQEGGLAPRVRSGPPPSPREVINADGDYIEK